MGQDIHLWIEYRRRGQLKWRILRQIACRWCENTGELWYDRDYGNGDVRSEPDVCTRCDGTGRSTLHEDMSDGRPYLTGGCAYVGRNYELFGALAPSGRRLGDPPLIGERGVPEDATPEFKRLVEQWGGDAHTHSWLDFNDVCAVLVYEVEMFLSASGDHTHEFRTQVVGLMAKISAKQGPENVRVVFFFDN